LTIFGISLINNLDFKIVKILSKKEWFLFLIMLVGFNYHPLYTTYFSKKLNSPILGVFIGEGTTFISNLIILSIFIFKKKINGNVKNINFYKLKYPLLSSFFLVIAFISLFTGTTKGFYSITSVLSYLSLLWLSLFAHLFLKEKLSLKQYLGVLCLVISLILIKILNLN